MKANEFHQSAAGNNHILSQLHLAQWYQMDTSAEKQKQAIKYYSMAVKLGCKLAAVPLKRLMEESGCRLQSPDNASKSEDPTSQKPLFWQQRGAQKTIITDTIEEELSESSDFSLGIE